MKSTKEGFIPYIYIKGQYRGGKRVLKSVIFFSSKMLTKNALFLSILFFGALPQILGFWRTELLSMSCKVFQQDAKFIRQ